MSDDRPGDPPDNGDPLGTALRLLELERDKVRALRAEADENGRETQHRIRNILSTVRSIVRRTIPRGDEAEAYQARLESRMFSFTRLQTIILRDPVGGVDLYTLVADELLTFGLKPGARALIKGDDIRLTARSAGVLGLAIHELGFMAMSDRLAGDDTQVAVRWHRQGDRHLRIGWTASGRRSGEVPDEDFGRDFVQTAVKYELGGEVWLDEADHGLICRFLLPLEHVVGPAVDAELSGKSDPLQSDSRSDATDGWP